MQTFLLGFDEWRTKRDNEEVTSTKNPSLPKKIKKFNQTKLARYRTQFTDSK
jgi:hypothetical protein